MDKGVFYGISVGPGEPELMTIKAINRINNTRVIATPRTKTGKTMALDIAKQIVDFTDKEIIYLDFVMSKDQCLLETSHKTEAQKIKQYLEQGIDVAMLNIGDASLYSTFSYMNAIITADGYESVVIPGVTSFCAVAALLNQSLTTMNEPMTIIPGGCNHLTELLATEGSKVIMKPAGATAEVKKVLSDLNLANQTKAVSDCGLATQKVYKSIDDIPNQGEYFITMLVE